MNKNISDSLDALGDIRVNYVSKSFDHLLCTSVGDSSNKNVENFIQINNANDVQFSNYDDSNREKIFRQSFQNVKKRVADSNVNIDIPFKMTKRHTDMNVKPPSLAITENVPSIDTQNNFHITKYVSTRENLSFQKHIDEDNESCFSLQSCASSVPCYNSLIHNEI